MNKLIYLLFLIALLASCATVKLPTTTDPATVIVTDSNWCVEKPFSASVNEDSLLQIATEGFILGDDNNNIKLYWQTTVTDPFNGILIAEPNLCISGTDFCIKGQYSIQVHQNNLTATLKTGMTFGTPVASIFVFYHNGKLTAIPKVCIERARTSRALR